VPKRQSAGRDTPNFAYPAFVSQEEIAKYGKTTSVEVERTEENEDNEGVLAENSLSSSTEERAGERSRNFYYAGGQVEIAAELVHELDAEGKQFRTVKLRNAVNRLRSLRYAA
jgi:type I restriction enzyme, R subunit